MTGHTGVSGVSHWGSPRALGEAVTGQSEVRKLHQGVGRGECRRALSASQVQGENTWHWAHKLSRMGKIQKANSFGADRFMGCWSSFLFGGFMTLGPIPEPRNSYLPVEFPAFLKLSGHIFSLELQSLF